MKPTTATSLRKENTNSASPNILTLHKLMTTITTKNVAEKVAGLMSARQYEIVSEAAISSSGRAISH